MTNTNVYPTYPSYAPSPDLGDMRVQQGKLRVIPRVLRRLQSVSGCKGGPRAAYEEHCVLPTEDIKMTDATAVTANNTAPPEPVVIDHTAFPHIIDSILGYASNDVLLRFRATSTEYYARISARLAGRIHVAVHLKRDGTGLERHARAVSDRQSLFLIKKPHPEAADHGSKKSKTMRHLVSPFISTPFKKVAESYRPGTHVAHAACEGTLSPVHVDTFFPASSVSTPSTAHSLTSSIDLAPRPIPTAPMPLLCYTRVLDIEARYLKPAQLYPLTKALRCLAESPKAAVSGSTPITPSVPLLRLLNFPSAGWGETCSIVAETLVVFMMDIFACPARVDSRLNGEPSLVPEGTKRLVVNVCGQHMLSYANVNALYDLPRSVTHVVLHIIDSHHLNLHCPRHDHNLGYAYLGVIMGRALEGGREVVITLPATESLKNKSKAGHAERQQERTTTTWSCKGDNTRTVTTIQTTHDAGTGLTTTMTATATFTANAKTGKMKKTSQTVRTAYSSATPLPDDPPFCARELMCAAAEQYLLATPRPPEEVTAHLARLQFYDADDYIEAVGRDEWLWEARP